MSSFRVSSPSPMSTPFATKPRDLPPLPYPAPPVQSIEPPTKHSVKVKSKPDRYDNVFKGGLGPDAPPKDLSWPLRANITAYEMLGFLPHSLMSADVVYRYISNGGTRHALWVLINVSRDLPKAFDPNRVGTIIYKAMNDAGLDNWTVKNHEMWHAAQKDSWDETVLEVTMYRTPSRIRGQEVQDIQIPFKNLAAGVRRLPQGDDALDLTKMVLYCTQHPEEQWMYPRDYRVLCNRLGGPTPVRKEHTDRAAFKRWEGQIPPPPRLWSDEEKEAAIKAMDSMLKKNGGSGARQKTPASTKGDRRETPASEKRSRKVTPAPTRRARQATPTPRTQQRGRGRPRKSTRLEEIELDDDEGKGDEQLPQLQPYIRAPAEYVAPLQIAKAPSAAAIILAFERENGAGETDPFAADAFGGPRRQPPYRMLHDIQQPDASNISGWAENWRWTWEQRACFWHTFETEGWNESPAHMELIARTRQKQVWASDELLEQLAEEEEEEDLEYEGF